MTIPQQTVGQMRALGLHAMADEYERQLEQPNLHQLAFDERLGLLIQRASAQRASGKLQRLIKLAKFTEDASLEEVDYRASRELSKSVVASLGTCEWIRRQQNLIVTGPTGIGKTWLACAFGKQACRVEMPTLFRLTRDLMSDIASAELDGSIASLKSSLVKPTLLILDDFGIGQISPTGGVFLLDVVERRLKTGALVITSQYSTDKWHGFFTDPTVADAFLDRVIHQAHRLAPKGESMRRERGRQSLGIE